MPKPLRILLILAAATLGVMIIHATGHLNDIPSNDLIIGVIAGCILGAYKPIANRIATAIDRLNRLTRRQRLYAVISIGIVSWLYFVGANWYLGKPLDLVWHDEYQFHLQTQMVARFRLWMPPHPLAKFFDTFYVLMEPKYASQSFPGAAMLFAPGVWLHLPTWAVATTITSIATALMWWLISKLVDNASATLATIVFLAFPGTLMFATMNLAQFPLLMLGMIGLLAYFHYARTGSYISATIVGAALGWAAITRPLDAMFYGFVIAIGFFATIKSRTIKRSLVSAVIVILAAMPFLAIQGVFNLAITDSVFKTPFQLYNERDQPALVFGNTVEALRDPQTDIPQKRSFYKFLAAGPTQRHYDSNNSVIKRLIARIDRAIDVASPVVWMLPMALIGVAGLTTRTRWLVFLLLPLFLFGYVNYPIVLSHYVICALPAVLLLYALSPGVISGLFNGLQKRIYVFIWTLILCASVGVIISTRNHGGLNPAFSAQVRLAAILRDHVRAPAIVLFTTPPVSEVENFEPVYNDDVIWPDDAPIIKAHDRGDQNVELYNYYATRQPQRTVWRYDRTHEKLIQLGPVAGLAK